MLTDAYPDVAFDPVAHRYWLGARELPSVTRVLSDVGVIDETWFTPEVAERGTFVHEACELIDLGQLDEATLDDRLLGYVAAYRTFLHYAAPCWSHIEHQVVDPVRGYAGRLDRAGSWDGVVRGVLDLKTGEPQAWVALQLAAYRRLLPEPHTWRRFALWLRPDGSYRLLEHTDRTDEAVFLAALQVTTWQMLHSS